MEKGWGKMLQPKFHSFGMPQKSPTPIQECRALGTVSQPKPLPLSPKAIPEQGQKDLWLYFFHDSKSCKFSKIDTEGKRWWSCIPSPFLEFRDVKIPVPSLDMEQDQYRPPWGKTRTDV